MAPNCCISDWIRLACMNLLLLSISSFSHSVSCSF